MKLERIARVANRAAVVVLSAALPFDLWREAYVWAAMDAAFLAAGAWAWHKDTRVPARHW